MADDTGNGAKSQGRAFMWIIISALVTGVVGIIAYYIESEFDELDAARHREVNRLEHRIDRLEKLHLK